MRLLSFGYCSNKPIKINFQFFAPEGAELAPECTKLCVVFPISLILSLIGTSLLLEVCKEVGVRHFLYCSTMDVVLGKDDIINGTEQSTHVPDVFFFNGYASTKQKAEEIVLAANRKFTGVEF